MSEQVCLTCFHLKIVGREEVQRFYTSAFFVFRKEVSRDVVYF